MVSNVLLCMHSRVAHILQGDHRGDGKDQHPQPVTFLPSLRVSHTARGENKNQEALLRGCSLHSTAEVICILSGPRPVHKRNGRGRASTDADIRPSSSTTSVLPFTTRVRIDASLRREPFLRLHFASKQSWSGCLVFHCWRISVRWRFTETLDLCMRPRRKILLSRSEPRPRCGGPIGSRRRAPPTSDASPPVHP